MKLGIVGLPNVGKSTLFNSLTKAGAQAANFPFCTIDPNVGIVPVPDERIEKLDRSCVTKIKSIPRKLVIYYREGKKKHKLTVSTR